MLTKEDFIQVAQPDLDKLQRYLNGQSIEVSDVIDAEGRQYVNLVQEGGGVLGIALVGYTYVLEKMGIRFMKMAGTSAGAINTMMLTCLGEKHEEKSLRILEILSQKPLFDFVDGPGWIRTLIKNLITPSGFLKRMLWLVGLTLVALIVSLFGVTYALAADASTAKWIFIPMLLITGGAVALAVWWLKKKSKSFYNAVYGLNPGNNFLDWVSEILSQNGVNNLEDLRRHVEKTPAGGFRLRSNSFENLDDLNQPKLEDFLTLVTSDVTNQIKVEFPRMWSLYWTNEKEVNPAYFVRASMAVPIFFRPFQTPEVMPEQVSDAWRKFAGIEETGRISKSAHFVDGGMISNFPINVFYNSSVQVPRLPTFGVMLDTGDDPVPGEERNSFLKFISAMFNTVRYNYDKEFLIKHADFNKTIGRIDASGINWLNFNLEDKDKLELFRRGAQAAVKFFMGEAYNDPDARFTPPLPDPALSENSGFESMKSRGAAQPEDLENADRSDAIPAAPKGAFNWSGYKSYREERKKTLGY